MNVRKLFVLVLILSPLVGCDSNPSGPAAPSNAASAEGSTTSIQPTAPVKGKNNRLKQPAGAVPAPPD